MLAVDSDRQQKINDLLQTHLDALHQEAEHNQSLFQLGKCAGLAGLVLGGVGCVALPPVGLVVVGSAIATYLTSLFSESAITQDLTPIPWSQTRLSNLAAGMIQEGGLRADDLEFVDYLPRRDQILYLLILTQGNRLANLLAQLPEQQWKPAIEGIIAQTIKVNGRMGYLDAVRDSNGILNVAERQFGFMPALPEPKPEPETPQIGVRTRINAIPVASVVEDEDPWQEPAQPMVQADPDEHLRCSEAVRLKQMGQSAISAIVDELRSTMFVAPSGAGKGVVISNCLRTVKQRIPSIHFFVIDPKNSPGETGYWNDPVFDTVHRISGQTSAPDFCKQILLWIEEFKSLPSPKLLFIDESVILTAKIDLAGEDGGNQLDKTLVDLMVWLTSGGLSEQQFTWVASQVGQDDALPFPTTIRNQLRTVVLTRTSDDVRKMSATKPPLFNTRVSSAETISQRLKESDRLMKAAGRPPNKGRAIYVSDIGEWMPMIPLKVYSATDRDLGVFTTV